MANLQRQRLHEVGEFRVAGAGRFHCQTLEVLVVELHHHPLDRALELERRVRVRNLPEATLKKATPERTFSSLTPRPWPFTVWLFTSDLSNLQSEKPEHAT